MHKQKCVPMVILKPVDNEKNHYIKCAVWCRKECEFRVAGKVDADKADVIVNEISAIKEKPEEEY